MHTIEIDFDVYKQLTLRRETEDVSYNDVLRDLLGLPSGGGHMEARPGGGAGDWVTKGVRFPEGTLFRARYRGELHGAKVKGGALVLDSGEPYRSPSAAAGAITKGAVNGWNFWECKRPGDTSWQPIQRLR